MISKTIQARVGPNGVLTLSVPFDPADANRDVTVTVREATPAMSAEDWARRVRELGGAIDDPTFEMHPQGEYETRDAFP